MYVLYNVDFWQGVTLTSDQVAESKQLPEIIELLRSYVPIPKAPEPVKKIVSTADKTIKIVLVGDSKCSCKTQVNPEFPKIEKLSNITFPLGDAGIYEK